MATTANSTGYGPRRALIFSGEESDAARDDGPKALEVLRQHYQGKGKPQVITTLKKTENESIVDYVIRAEAAATALRNADEAVKDALLIAMVLKRLTSNYKTSSAIVVQQDEKMTFIEFKVSLRS